MAVTIKDVAALAETGRMIPMVREFWEARLLAWKLGSYPNCAMARRTFSFVSSLIEINCLFS